MVLIEQLLNVAWVVLAIGSFATLLVHRRDGRAIFALAFALALLFPIISASDDMMNVDRALEEVVAVLAAFAIAFILIVVARLSTETHRLPTLILAPEAETRGPPRR
jgi:UDP-N-acetylmuramyl pentapeptide phosphotransferase/UDP-N-acetylglucosamine-1-phosphate transferase